MWNGEDNMTRNQHITRNFNANKTNIIRVEGEKFRFEIFRYDKTQDTMYSSLNPSDFEHNGSTCWFDGMTGLKSKGKNELKLDFKYEAKSNSNHYKIELLYTNSYKITGKEGLTKDSNISLEVNKEKVAQNVVLVSNDMMYNRYQQYVSFKEGVNEITVKLSPNMIFYGIIIRKYEIWEAHYPLKHDDDLVPISAETSITNQFDIHTMTASFMYSHALDEKLAPTDINANRSGLVFDYRDEINLYVFNTNNIEEQVFGGYISTANVDDKLTTLTLQCADRIIDMDRRYCLSEILLNGFKEDDSTKYTFAQDCLKKYDYYSDGIGFLCNSTELPIKTNVIIGKSLIPKRAETLANYRKGKYTKLTPNNISFVVEKDYIQLRNGIDRNKEQRVVLYDSKSKKVSLNNYPNLFITYGMGEKEWEDEVVETITITKQKGISQSVKKWADKYAKGVSGSKAIKPLWSSIVNNIKQNSKKRGFYQTPSKTLTSKVGNCCCKAELLLDMCNYKGVTDLKYVYVKPSKGTGHVFCKINGKIIDPSTSKGWGNYVKGHGTLSNAKYTDYPEKPF